ncbi:MAG: hypothetical protein MJ114_00460 [Acetatifactor sp.]|nr:hypothetical protein [Acetatifactor sp.]
MSKKVEEVTEQKPEKVLTKYDLKMQKRAEEKARAKKEKLVSNITTIVVVLAVAALVLSFPIRSYLAVNGAYINVGGEKVTKVEFDYQYNLTKNNYIAQYGYYMSMFGMDFSGDLSAQQYSEDLSWQDYFEQLTVESIKKNRALYADAKAAGFTYDTSDDYKQFLEDVKSEAKEYGVTEKVVLQDNYGEMATISRLKKYVLKDLEIAAYYEKIAEDKMPADAEVTQYYVENATNYDSIDYVQTVVTAVLPTEPTDLAEEGAEVKEGETYVPSEAEVEFAMKEAKGKADAALKNIDKDGEVKENIKGSAMTNVVREWLFAAERKAGDTAVLENTSGRSYYVVKFNKRYLDETVSKDARIIIADPALAQAYLNEWKSGAATEESFAEIADQYNNEDVTAAKGGLYEGLLATSVPEGMDTWLYEEGRKKGDTTVIAPEGDEFAYVVYFVGDNDPEWKLSVKSTLQSDAVNTYINDLIAGYSVSDPKGHLNYLKVQASKAAESDEE